MNQIITPPRPSFTGPLTHRSPELADLLAFIAAGAAERDRERIHPLDVFDLIRSARLGALRLQAADGGPGATLRELFEVVIALAAADPNIAHSLRNHYAFVERFSLSRTVLHRAKWAGIVAEGAIVALASTELGSARVGASPFATKLRRDGDGFRLSGTKYYSTGTLYADYVQVRAAGPDDEVLTAIIPTTRSGVERIDDWDGAGQRLTGSGTTHFDDVRVEADEVEPDSLTAGYGVPHSNSVAQLLVTATVAGILRNVETDAVALLASRKDRHFYFAQTERVADDPLLQEIVGRISADAFAAEAVILAAADAHEAVFQARARGEPDAALAHAASVAAAKAKLVVDELTIRDAGHIFDVAGASATRRAKNLDRHWRNARTLASHNPAALKARALGDYALHGTQLPEKGFF
ncbi:acyl-CoA dehydrogenase [Azorhizobium oxalatiphilum]|uniref:Acyl-CoA dehydrogenase n=1 Tax=Azorhizobium oxalatiphilum TaxID=980631 RepID=A0A917CL94_9HYPH|nr:acyl-CoA dehydrogenase [Azorhizobium oxalatiphilum]GGF89910.1 acyl-CoA dehydrogenase [Azorhizobium oxalatiphilum]